MEGQIGFDDHTDRLMRHKAQEDACTGQHGHRRRSRTWSKTAVVLMSVLIAGTGTIAGAAVIASRSDPPVGEINVLATFLIAGIALPIRGRRNASNLPRHE